MEGEIGSRSTLTKPSLVEVIVTPAAPVDVSTSDASTAISHLPRLLGTAVLAGVAMLGVATFGPLFGMHLGIPTLLILACGAVIVEGSPAHSFEVTAAVGLAALVSVNRVYSAYHLVLVVALYLARRRTLGLIVVLVYWAIILPKHLYSAHYHQPGYYNWINEPSLALVLFATARWWTDQRGGRRFFSGATSTWPKFAALYFFPGHAVNPIVYGAADITRRDRADVHGVVAALLLVASKALAHATIQRAFPMMSYVQLGIDDVYASSLGRLWAVVVVNYLDLALTLSGTADLAVVIARLYGWPMPSPFRWALLAWNPIELWRRWGLYNRKLLLGMVYFPLGGNQGPRNVRTYVNIMLTFLASALIMHSGWFGSKYWFVGLPGWRDESLYFLLQGLAVCTCLFVQRLRGFPWTTSVSDRTLRWSWGRAAGTLTTQATSALIHVVILAQAVPLRARFVVIGRCLGVPYGEGP